MCLSNDRIEDAETLFAVLQPYLYLGRNLLARTHALIRPFGFANLSNEAPTKLSLYGDNNLAHHVNGEILQLKH